MSRSSPKRPPVRLTISFEADPGSIMPQGFRLYATDVPIVGKNRPAGVPRPEELLAIFLQGVGYLNLEMNVVEKAKSRKAPRG